MKVGTMLTSSNELAKMPLISPAVENNTVVNNKVIKEIELEDIPF